MNRVGEGALPLAAMARSLGRHSSVGSKGKGGAKGELGKGSWDAEGLRYSRAGSSPAAA